VYYIWHTQHDPCRQDNKRWTRGVVSGSIRASSMLMAAWKKEPPGEGMVNKLSQSFLAAGRDCSRLVMSTAAPATEPMPPYIMTYSWKASSGSVVGDEVV